jgi:hypothetical protein
MTIIERLFFWDVGLFLLGFGLNVAMRACCVVLAPSQLARLEQSGVQGGGSARLALVNLGETPMDATPSEVWGLPGTEKSGPV